MLEMDQFAFATAPTSFVKLMEMHHSVSGKLQCHKQHHEHNVAISDLHTGNHHLIYAYWHSWPTWYPIHHRFWNRSLLNPLAFTPAYFLPTYLPCRKWIQMNILYWLIGHLYTTCTICDYWRRITAKCNCRSYCVTCQNFFNFSDNNVRHDSSSVHVQGSYGPYEHCNLQIELFDNSSTGYCAASYRSVRTCNLNSR
jgi:hypothetical protein